MTGDMIRQATEQDIPALVDIGRKFYALTTIKDIEFCEQSVGMMLKTLIKGENSVVFVDDAVTGTIGGMVYPFWINTAHMSGNETFWWVDTEARGALGLKLWTKLENWAKSKGVSLFQMMALENPELNRLENIYKHRGYVPTERIFIKAL